MQSLNPTKSFLNSLKAWNYFKKSFPDLQFNDVTYSSDFEKGNALNKILEFMF